MTELAEFLLARIAEDEAKAQALLKRAQKVQALIKDNPTLMLGRFIPGWHDWPEVEAMAARVLAECDAKRRIVTEVVPRIDRLQDAVDREWGANEDDATKDFLQLLALPYADHPDYQQEWKP